MQRIITAALTGAAMVLALVALPTMASAKSIDTTCAKELNLEVPSANDATQRTPVILVHGIWGDSSSMKVLNDSVTSMDKVTTYNFNYLSTNAVWVTGSGTDHRLAKTIVCYSKLYDNKKVVIVAHSMGGLLTRAALDWAAYGTFAKVAVGYVITIGTPHEGANLSSVTNFINTTLCNTTFVWFGTGAQEACRIVEDSKAASAMRPGSPQLAELPHFPDGVLVKAIAGDVQHMMCTGWGCYDAYDNRSDLVVSIDSATAEYTTTGVGDGKTILKCNDGDKGHNGDESWCSHTNIHKSIQVQQIVKNSLSIYLDSVKVDVENEVSEELITTKVESELHDYYMYDDFFARFSLPFLVDWGASMSQPGMLLNAVDNSECQLSNSECPRIIFRELKPPYKEAFIDPDPIGTAVTEMCFNADGEFAGWAQPVQRLMIGGKQAEFYAQLLCHSANGEPTPVYMWYIPDNHLLVIAYDSAGYKVDLNTVTTVIDNIEWR